MQSFTAEEIAGALEGRLAQGNPLAIFENVSTDTRNIQAGDLFIALVGERFDAHDFIDKAIAGGAKGLVVSKPVGVGMWHGAVIVVRDTLKALQDLAGLNRQKFGGLVIGVTGSNGKTTTKDMLFSVLQQKYKTLKTEGNFNNHIGLPLTLLKLDQSFGAAVLEMGMRGLGEIDLLAGITKPEGAIITNIGETHVERLGSVETIAKAKGEILDHVDSTGFAVLNGDDVFVRQQAFRCRGKLIFYGTGQDASVYATNILARDGRTISFTLNSPCGQIDINLPVPGKHNVLNALAASAVGLEAGIVLEQIKNGLETVSFTGMRIEIIEGSEITVINDAYNASPASVKAALGILSDMGSGRRKVAILGDMYELGHRTKAGHREVGMEAAAKKVDVLVTVGKLASEIALGATLSDEPPAEIVTFNNNEEIKKYLKKIIFPGDVVLVKGSRGMKLEEVVAGLAQMFN